jgi:hypothetical protein
MKAVHLEHRHDERAEMRALVAIIDPATPTGQCPVCQRVGMREAIRCGYCWTRLVPLGRRVQSV